jgi:hypothetical protein
MKIDHGYNKKLPATLLKNTLFTFSSCKAIGFPPESRLLLLFHLLAKLSANMPFAPAAYAAAYAAGAKV